MNYCKKCGSPLGAGDAFCAKCGEPVSINTQNGAMPPTPPKNNTGLIIGIIAAIVAGVIAAGVIIFFISSNNTKPEPTPEPTPTAAVTEAPATPTPMPITRVSTYSPNYSYKRMNDIHSSTPATDDEMRQMYDVISGFNNTWVNYVNTGSIDFVFDYLREGSQAYNNAIKYGRKNIKEQYELMEIQDARRTDSYYYVWMHEILDEISSETKRLEYHWVYKIGHDEGGYYIDDYTADPAY